MGVGLGFPVVAKMGARRGLPPDRRGVRGRSRAPIFTQRAVDMIANGTAGRQLVWLGFGAIAAVGIEAALTSVRQSLVMRLISLLNGRISRKAFMHLMRMRIDLGVFPAGDVLNRFQQADKIPQFVLELVPRVVFDTGDAVVSLLLMTTP
jgi:ABC-type bacteriocin/lantibiotic exporter with double-glycine peptidase domain